MGRLRRLLSAGPAGTVLVVVGFYALGSELAWHGFGADVGLAFFPPAGVTIAALLLSPRRWWPLLAAAVFVTELAVDVSQHLGFGYAVGYAVANTIEPVAGAFAFERLNPTRISLGERRGKLAFLTGAVGVGGLAGALVGGTTARWQRPASNWFSNVWHWWAGDGVAILAIGATIVLAGSSRLTRRRRWELVAAGLVTGAATVAGLWTPLAPATVVLPVLTVLAFVLGPLGATLGGTAVALVANYATNAGHGFFATLDSSPSSRLASLQLFIAVLVIVGWSIGVEVQARTRAVSEQVGLLAERDEATAVVDAIHRAVAPQPAARAGPFRVGSCYRQSSGRGLVGGDWFDAFELPKNRVLFVVGDVGGHGLDAMEDMAHLRLASRAFATEGHDPAQLLAELDLYAGTATRGQFATMLAAIYDPTTSGLMVASAGHPPPLVRRSDRRSGCVGVRPGPPLGVNGHAPYHQTFLPVGPGTAIVFYTDGVIERRGRSLDDGLAQLSDAFDRVDLHGALDHACTQLIDDCFPDDPTDDDQCILLVTLDDGTTPAL